MPHKLTASMPEGMDLDASYTVQWAALDPTDGSVVTGVVVSDAAMLVTQVSPGTADDLSFGPFAPMFIPVDFAPPSGPGTSSGG